MASLSEAPAGTLLVDLGNTRIKWAWLDGQVLQEFGVQPWEVAAATDQPFAAMDASADGSPARPVLLLPLTRGRRPERVLFSPMTRAVGNARLALWARQQHGVLAEPCPSESQRDGLVNGYAEPARLGADRWWALVAAWRRIRGPVMVVDAGTALTIDGVDARGRHVVGYLQPGRELQLRALAAHTGVAATVAEPPVVAATSTATATDSDDSPTVTSIDSATDSPTDRAAAAATTNATAEATSAGAELPQPHGQLDTAGCIDAALTLGHAALVEAAWRRFVQDWPGARLLLTGGGATGLATALPALPFEHCPHLVLDGLAARAEDA